MFLLACLCAYPCNAQLPDRAPARNDVFQGLDTLHASELDSICEEPRHWALKRAFQGFSGTAIHRDSAEHILEVRHYLNGIPNGTWCGLDDGHVINLYTFDTSEVVGSYVDYYPSGAKYREGPMDRPGLAFARIFAGIADGVHRAYYESGSIRQEITYERSGVISERNWYPNGQRESEWVERAGFRYYQQWCSNGKRVGHFRQERTENGKMHGTLVVMHINSREPFILHAKKNKFKLVSSWDGEVIRCRSSLELGQVLKERSLMEPWFRNADEEPFLTGCELCD
jgi:antitoxin component YwqK of YwqJK toxin-antitoxin module